MCLPVVSVNELMQVLRGAGKVGSSLVSTQGEQLRLMACNSTVGAAVKAAQELVEGLMGTVMGGSATQQSIKDVEDVFATDEGWEAVDREEASKWAVGSEFPPDETEQTQPGAGAAEEIPTAAGIVEELVQ